jgi:hypothetical protein
MIGDVGQAVSMLDPQDRVLTTSYLVPQISHRKHIAFAKQSLSKQVFQDGWNVFLLNPTQPGWGSEGNTQSDLLSQAKGRNWTCQNWNSGLELCRKPYAK